MPTIKIYWFWLKHPMGFNRSCGPLSDTLQADAWLFPLYRKWPDHVGRFWPIEKAVNTLSFPPGPAFWSIRVVLWLLFFRSAPSSFPQGRGYLLGACFGESLVIRLHSEIDQIHLSIEAQCDHLFYQWVYLNGSWLLLIWYWNIGLWNGLWYPNFSFVLKYESWIPIMTKAEGSQGPFNQYGIWPHLKLGFGIWPHLKLGFGIWAHLKLGFGDSRTPPYTPLQVHWKLWYRKSTVSIFHSYVSYM